MSNLSILQRLRKASHDYEMDELSSEEFSALLNNVVEALEGIPYRVIREMRTFRHRIEISGFHEEDENISDRKTVAAELRAWMTEVENQNIQK